MRDLRERERQRERDRERDRERKREYQVYVREEKIKREKWYLNLKFMNHLSQFHLLHEHNHWLFRLSWFNNFKLVTKLEDWYIFPYIKVLTRCLPVCLIVLLNQKISLTDGRIWLFQQSFLYVIGRFFFGGGDIIILPQEIF